MRRLFAAAAVCAATMLLAGAAVAAAAPPAYVGDGHHEVRGLEAKAAMPGGHEAKVRFAPLGARLAGGATVTGTLYDSYGSTQAGKDVAWYAWSEAEQAWYSGEGTTGSGGTFSLSGVIPTASGEVWAYPDADTAFAVLGQTWAGGGTYPYSLYPGRIGITAHRGGRWGDFSAVVLRLYGSNRYSRSTMLAPDESSTPVTGAVDVMSGAYAGGSVKFFWDEGLEFIQDVNVSAGSQAGTITAHEADAQRVWFSSPYWYSGKPGTTVTVKLEGFGTNWINRVTGYTDDPSGTASRTFGHWTSAGPQAQTLRVKIPATAKPGYAYWLGFQHVDSSDYDYPLYLEEGYQVATMKASKTSIRRGTKIRLKGVVPTQGHWGSQAGLKKVVTVYAHKGKAAVPTKWDPRKQGWFKLGTVRTNGLGAYTTPYFKPPSTHTLVVRYPGDDWYWDGYTSVQKITVR